MYDILQLNDMLVPELLDIAEQQSISNANTLEKQELIYKILDKQAVMNNNEKKPAESEKPKRKRIIKTVSEEVPHADAVIPDATKEIKPKKIDEKK
ncbi:MAG TPA: Rho termination factor N-terminal domain-containing protein, partial [Ginsengibacter sp.]